MRKLHTPVTKWIKILATISIIAAVLVISSNLSYNPYAHIEFLITGLAYLLTAIGLYNLKKWALYGQTLLMLYSLLSSLCKFVILKNKYFSVTVGMETYIVYTIAFLLGILIFYKIFWKNRNLFT